MAYLISAFGWIISAVSGWFVAMFTRKILVAVAALSSFVLLTAALVTSIKSILITVLGSAVVPPWFNDYLAMFMPANFTVVLSSILAAHIIRWAYDKAMDKVRLISSAS